MAHDPNDRTVIERVDPLLGSVLDRRYRIDARIAAGGFGAIYRATHVGSGHEVALKVLHQRLATDRGVVARFRREGATLTSLRSPYTIAAYEIGESAADQILYIVMELLRGVSLFERFRASGPIPWRTMAKIARQVCHSLQEAHQLGIVHRDLKPTNIHLEPMSNDPDHVKVLDFGIAKILQDSSFDASDLTNAGQMIGTLDYMSPEQMVGGLTTGQTDIYVLGIVMYEMITGTRPFAEMPSAAATLAAMLKTTPQPISRRIPVPPEIDRIVAKCLEREPVDRYQDVAALGRDLDRLLPHTDDNDATRVVVVDEVGERVTARTQAAVSEETVHAVPPPPTPRPRSPSAPITTLPGGYTPPPELRGALDRAGQPRAPKSSTTPPPIRTRPPVPPARAQREMPPFASDDDGLTVPMQVRPQQVMDLNQFGQPRQRPPTPPPQQFPMQPPVRPPSAPQPHHFSHGENRFDMDQIAARDAVVRRTVWIIVLVVAVVIAVAVASQL